MKRCLMRFRIHYVTKALSPALHFARLFSFVFAKGSAHKLP